MATHSSILAWKFPWTEEPGALQSTRLQRVGHDWACRQDTVITITLYIVRGFLCRLCLPACRILGPQPGIEPVPPAVQAWSPNYWTARDFLVYIRWLFTSVCTMSASSEQSHCPKNPLCFTCHPPPPLPAPGNYWPSFCLHSYAFSRMSYAWNHKPCSLFRLASSNSNMPVSFLYVFSQLWQLMLFLVPIVHCLDVP